MKLSIPCGAALALLVSVAGTPLLADPATPSAGTQPATTGSPDVATLLFGMPQWTKAPAGSVITYDYSRKATDKSYGASFDDTITVTLGAGDDPQSRTAEVVMFTGAHRIPAGPFRADQQNPVLLLAFENNVQELSKLFHANPRYLKNAIRKAWRDSAKVEKTDVEVDGKSVPGTRISVTPFVGNAEADKMKGLDDMVYSVEIADSVPGNIAKIDIHAPATGPQKFSEVLRFKSVKTP